MFSHILVPVDPAQAEGLKKAVDLAADVAHRNAAEMTLVTVTGPAKAKEVAARLQDWADQVAVDNGLTARSHVIEAADPAVELGERLVEAVRQTGADLVVMGSHAPDLADHIFQGNAAHVAAHAPCSVFVVR